MPYTPTSWVNGTTPVNATNMNHLETQYTESTLSFGPDLLAPFVLSGLVCTIDGSVLNQLDVTAGDSYLAQTDLTLRQRTTAASTPGQFTTSVINTTYYLFLKNDGTFQWGTTSTGPANSLAICQATTNASGNLLVVTDKRMLNVTLLPNMLGTIIAGSYAAGAFGWLKSAIGGTFPTILSMTPSGATVNNLWSWLYSGTDGRLLIQDVTGGVTAFQAAPGGKVGFNQGVGLVSGQATAGSFGVPAVMAATKRQNVTTNAVTTIATWTAPASGGPFLVRVWMQGWVGAGDTNTSVLTMQYTYTDPDLGAATALFVNSGGTPISAFAGGKGALTKPLVAHALVSASTTVNVQYQNNVAGTISDFVTAHIEAIG